ncbi:MAG: M20 aminoacylase family protein [Planctomycetota bacterium]
MPGTNGVSERDRIDALRDELVAWRHDLHMHPEMAYHEHRTSDFVAKRLTDAGLPIHRGLGKTGVVATLKAGQGSRTISLRADMDALPITEESGKPWASTTPGTMHACGHDGHTTMLLGAATALAAEPDFDGTVHFIFQPAEEMAGGGKAMIDDGLFEQFPTDAVFGMHNFPGVPQGTFAMRAGPMMAAADRFEIVVQGRGGHAAQPHRTLDPVPVAAEIVLALQSIVSRRVDPLAHAVLSITQILAGDAMNIVPDRAVLRGTVRTFDPAVQDAVEADLRRVVEGVCHAHGLTQSINYMRGYPATVNAASELDSAANAARRVAGDAHVVTDTPPVMAAEDFSFMLQRRPGMYVFLGAGDTPGLHNPRYDFNDEILTTGVRYWVELVRTRLAR